jgi:hypothetical protein
MSPAPLRSVVTSHETTLEPVYVFAASAFNYKS